VRWVIARTVGCSILVLHLVMTSMPKHPRKRLTRKKARKILRHGSVRGKKLTGKQKRFLGAVAGGEKPRKR
jgi:hypothetical protein